MREILFRGKRKDNGEWICGGSLIQTFDNGVYIPKCGETASVTYDIYTDHIASVTYENDARFYKVDPETVGQYTGFTDKNVKKIFEGDIVAMKTELAETVGYISYSIKSARFACKTRYKVQFTLDNTFEYDIIGNIHDNPELLKIAERRC